VVEDGAPVVLRGEDGAGLLPSVVGYLADGTVVVEPVSPDSSPQADRETVNATAALRPTIARRMGVVRYIVVNSSMVFECLGLRKHLGFAAAGQLSITWVFRCGSAQATPR